MTPVERLRAFLAEMLAWEVAFVKQQWACSRNLRDADREGVEPSFREKLYKAGKLVEEEGRERCRSILKEHLSAKAFATAEKEYLYAMVTSKPSSFLQEVLAETESHKGETISIEAVRKERSGTTHYIKYALVMENGEPKIDVVRRRRENEDKWEKCRDFYVV